MDGLDPGFGNWGWGGQITLYGLVMVFLMLLVLMLFLLGVARLDSRLAARAAAEEAPDQADEPAALVPAPAKTAIADGDIDQGELAALAIALHQTLGGADVHSAAHLAALGLVLETILHGSGSVPALVANQSGAGLAESRWVAAGRSTQMQSWQRS